MLRGPPPRMRGRPPSRSPLRAATGTTPAYAGKTCRLPICSGLPGDHPRVCGEDFSLLLEAPTQPGPPPRMRGRRTVTISPEPRRGTTPAYAGKTLADLEQCRATGHSRYDCFSGMAGSEARLNRNITVAVWGLRTVHDWLPYFDLARLPGWLVTPLVDWQGRNGAHDEVLDLFQCRPFSGSGQG